MNPSPLERQGEAKRKVIGQAVGTACLPSDRNDFVKGKVMEGVMEKVRRKVIGHAVGTACLPSDRNDLVRKKSLIINHKLSGLF